MPSLPDRLFELGLWRGDRQLDAALTGPSGLLRLAFAGKLHGALAVALDVRPDELIGPLCAALEGAAKHLKVLDVLERTPLEMVVEREGRQETWSLADLRETVHALNRHFAKNADTRVIAILGEWEESLILFCIPKTLVPVLRREDFFQPENARALTSAR